MADWAGSTGDEAESRAVDQEGSIEHGAEQGRGSK